MEDFIFKKNTKGISRKDIMYSGLYAVLIAIILVFGYVLVFAVDIAYCNLTRLTVSFFIVLMTSWIVLLIRRC